ncbi:hypothetical protein [Helicobacter cappadocius]|uniref:Uncharacterized protein n=1 Tax=Helicobacter cappadocius TaxID=3063998 RepID=A0AA90T4G7_9HELI|nr:MULTISPECIES: hypothetical protein [unclassified Helicobacter]MDO7252416.1 hypothetical protein [Helicobacter sp. faydin-H75]MDP2538283.1 hypothetical protein [Helicobacter sp. faydin-H76]
MFYSFLKYLDAFLDARTKKELYLILISAIGVMFCIVYLCIIPPSADFLNNKKNAYEQAKFIFSQNVQRLKKISPSASQEDIVSKTQALQKNLFVFKQASKTDYDILGIITRLTQDLKLDIVSDMILEDKNIVFTINGKFEDIVEFIRLIEEHYFVFIQDLELKPNNERIDCTLHLANLGTLLWNL